MARFVGIKCEECTAAKVEGQEIQGLYAGSGKWSEIFVSGTGEGEDAAIFLGPGIDPGQDVESRYFCGPVCMFKHIAKLLKIDPTTLRR